jgi:hypothetical protein
MTSAAASSAANDDSARAATHALSVEQFNGSHQIGTLVNKETTTTTTSSTPSITVEELFITPLDQLLAQAGAEIADASITDPNFYGAVVVRTGHPILLLMPVGRDEFVRDTCARKLLADALGLNTTALPDSLATLTLSDFTAQVREKAARP